jgi:hypothetical protein
MAEPGLLNLGIQLSNNFILDYLLSTIKMVVKWCHNYHSYGASLMTLAYRHPNPPLCFCTMVFFWIRKEERQEGLPPL